MRYTTLAVFAAALTLLAACGGEETTSAPEPTSPPIVQPDDNTKPDDTTPPNEHPDAGSDQQPNVTPDAEPSEEQDLCVQAGGETFIMPTGPCRDDRGAIVPLDEDLRHLLTQIPGQWRNPTNQRAGDVERITDENGGDQFTGFPSLVFYVDVLNIRTDGCFVQVIPDAHKTVHACFGFDRGVFVLDFSDGGPNQTEFMGRDALYDRLVYDGPILP